ncbi:flagellar basal body-associated protein FliL [Pantoea sp. Eser]|nr:flagellar basal body-associated protein FliL [Pantoea sp. Eser]
MPKTKKKASGKGSKRSLIILLLMLIIPALGGMAGYMFYQINTIKSQGKAEKETAQKTESAEKNVAAKQPIYIELDTFTVSLKPVENDSGRVLYVGLTLRLKDENSKVLIGQFLPEVRSRLLLLFSQQTGAELATETGKLDLIRKIKDVVSLPLTDQHHATVDDVLFNAFIIR